MIACAARAASNPDRSQASCAEIYETNFMA
jgi:hypothetical protein